MPDSKTNILVIWGDDIGISNLSCYSMGLMGYRTPNIDRLAAEGILFTDSYGEQSCTAGRAAFISGQSVYRTGMSKVGAPSYDIGWAAEDPDHRRTTQTAWLRYRAVRQESLRRSATNICRPCTVSIEFFGNLYHLNAEEEPELARLPEEGAVAQARTNSPDLAVS